MEATLKSLMININYNELGVKAYCRKFTEKFRLPGANHQTPHELRKSLLKMLDLI